MFHSIPSFFRIRNHRLFWLVCALLLGTLLRLIFPGDIEFKADEAYNFSWVSRIQKGEADWPVLGMTSSHGYLSHPGLSIWIFIILSKIFSVETPIDLARSVELLNCLAFAVAACFACRLKNEREQNLWFWGLALAAVNPLTIVLHRKLWPQCTQPLFAILLWISWYFRERNVIYAFFWGLLSILIGQLHLSGWIPAAALFLSTLFFLPKNSKVLLAFITGSIIGLIPLIPWFQALLHGMSERNGHFDLHFIRLVMFKFWNYWFTGTTGLMTDYSLGKHYVDFLSFPRFGSSPTYLVALAHIGLLVCAVASLYFIGTYWIKGRHFQTFNGSQKTQTDFLISTMILGAGFIYTVLLIAYQHHYMLIFFPLQTIWQARVFYRGTSNHPDRWLGIYWAFLLFVSVSFAFYIHINGGAPLGDFGIPYSLQGAIH